MNAAAWVAIFFLACLVLNLVGRVPTARRPLFDCLRSLQSIRPWEEVSVPTRRRDEALALHKAADRERRGQTNQRRLTQLMKKKIAARDRWTCRRCKKKQSTTPPKSIIFAREAEAAATRQPTSGCCVAPAMVTSQRSRGSPRSEPARVWRRDKSSVAAQQEISCRAIFEQEAPAACLGRRDLEISADCAHELLRLFGCDCRLLSARQGYASAVQIEFMFFSEQIPPTLPVLRIAFE